MNDSLKRRMSFLPKAPPMTPAQRLLAARAKKVGFKGLYIASVSQYPVGDTYLYKRGHLYGTRPGCEATNDFNVPEVTEEQVAWYEKHPFPTNERDQ